MAKLYKVEMYILDVNESYENIDEIMQDVENRSEANFKPFNVQELSFEWDDDNKLNYTDATYEDYNGLFPKK